MVSYLHHRHLQLVFLDSLLIGKLLSQVIPPTTSKVWSFNTSLQSLKKKWVQKLTWSSSSTLNSICRRGRNLPSFRRSKCCSTTLLPSSQPFCPQTQSSLYKLSCIYKKHPKIAFFTCKYLHWTAWNHYHRFPFAFDVAMNLRVCKRNLVRLQTSC